MKSQGYGLWYALQPKRLSRHSKKHNLYFAEYTETPSVRTDGQWYQAFLFRNDDYSLFGIKEFIGSLIHHDDMRTLATKVICDTELMKSLLTDDSDVKRIWKDRE